MCQLAFGNTRAVFINLRKDEVAWAHGAPSYYASSTFAKRGLRGHCGTQLSLEYDGSQRLDSSIGSLDDPATFSPGAHFAIATRIAAWHVEDGLPGERLDANAPILARWKQAHGHGVTPGLEATRET